MSQASGKEHSSHGFIFFKAVGVPEDLRNHRIVKVGINL